RSRVGRTGEIACPTTEDQRLTKLVGQAPSGRRNFWHGLARPFTDLKSGKTSARMPTCRLESPMSFSFPAWSQTLKSIVAQSANLRNANLPIGGECSANQEIGVPRTSVPKHKQPIMFGFRKLNDI